MAGPFPAENTPERSIDTPNKSLSVERRVARPVPAGRLNSPLSRQTLGGQADGVPDGRTEQAARYGLAQRQWPQPIDAAGPQIADPGPVAVQ